MASLPWAMAWLWKAAKAVGSGTCGISAIGGNPDRRSPIMACSLFWASSRAPSRSPFRAAPTACWPRAALPTSCFSALSANPGSVRGWTHPSPAFWSKSTPPWAESTKKILLASAWKVAVQKPCLKLAGRGAGGGTFAGAARARLRCFAQRTRAMTLAASWSRCRSGRARAYSS